MVFEKNLGSAKTFENAKALKGNIVASEGIGYSDNTIKQWKVYAPDLHNVVVTSYVRFKEKVPSSTLDLKLQMQLSGEDFVEDWDP